MVVFRPTTCGIVSWTPSSEPKDIHSIPTDTEWRKTSTHQGGFLLDGGVHYVAGLRQLIDAAGDRMERVSSFTTLLKSHLAPFDTINAVIRTESGISGTFQLSVGTTLRGDEFTVACENGVVTVNGSDVKIVANGKETQHSISNEKTGVPPEVRAWGEAIAAGKTWEAQEPENALADLELVSPLSSLRTKLGLIVGQLELMLRSGEQGGSPMTCAYQRVQKW